MIVIPASISEWEICAESDAESFLVDQFMSSWKMKAVTSITMHGHRENSTETIVISNQNPFRAMSLIEESIKKFVKERDSGSSL